MNYVESISNITRKLSSIGNVRLFESKNHLDHPEDLVFLEDVAGVRRALRAFSDTVKSPKNITIKWDGYPAIVFGRGNDGKFSIMDKHMFNKKDGSGRLIYSPLDFKKYDDARGVERNSLHQLVARLWPELEKAVLNKGYYWGDLLFSEKLENSQGQYKFKANPNGILYSVDVDSDIGKMIAGKIAGIAVHQYISPSAMSVDEAVSLHGSIGNLKNNTGVALIPSKMPIAPKLTLNKELVSQVENALKTYGQQVTNLMSEAPQARNSFNQLFTTYVNKKIVSGDLSNMYDDFAAHVQSRKLSEGMLSKIINHLNEHKQGLMGAFKIWIALYNLKSDLIRQLDDAAKSSPVKGYLSNGKESHEGFVSQGIKLVDRLGFSRQNLSNQ